MGLALGSCDKAPDSSAPTTGRADAPITVASLVPAATDLIDAMGARDQLVAVSNYDGDELAGELPRVGDYQNADWERLRQLRPGVMVIFQDPARVSEGWKQRAEELKIRLVNVRTETLADISAEARRLGELIRQQQKAEELVKRIESRLAEVAGRAAGKPRVKTLILMGSDARAAVGTGNFLNDILQIAGGANVIDSTGWPTLDREQLRALAPEAIIVLLSGVPEHVEKQARENVAALDDLPALKNGRVLVINKWYAHQSGSHVVDLAEMMVEWLHPREGGMDQNPLPRTRGRGQGEGRDGETMSGLPAIPLTPTLSAKYGLVVNPFSSNRRFLNWGMDLPPLPVRRERVGERAFPARHRTPLPPTLSPEYGAEGARAGRIPVGTVSAGRNDG